jgi:hypothetical protein
MAVEIANTWVASFARDSSNSMRVAFAGLLVFFAAFVPSSDAQLSPVPVKAPFWDDTTNDSPIYPVGDAVPVYRAVLDLIYLDGSRRPSVIIIVDSADRGHMGGPCPFAKCVGDVWKHKSKMDTSTVLAYARMTRKRPGLVQFGYPIPIVFISDDDRRRMEADGRELNASHQMPPDLPQHSWGSYAELQRKYAGAWGVMNISKVGFNNRRTEALVQVHEMCGEDCRVHETLFLKRTKGRWRVIERIPEEVEPGTVPYGRYTGPAGIRPKDSEILPVDRPGSPLEATARDDVYRIVLDSLYSVNTQRPKRIVLTNWFWLPGGIPAHTSTIDPALVQRFSFLGSIRAPFDAISRYRVPISTLPLDSVPALRERGAALDVERSGYPFWIAFAKKYPDAWGMLGVSRITFNPNRSQALVSTDHACGNSCTSRDTWFLTRSGKTWRIAERIPREKQNYVEVEPLRYVGVDVSPIAYRPRRVQGVVTDAEGKAMAGFKIRVRRLINSGVMIDDPSLRTDSLGRFTLTRLPINAGISLFFDCPNGQREPVFFKAIGVTPGMDTTINASFPFAECNQTPPDSAGRVSGVSSIPQGPSFSQRFMWMYLTPGANPDFRTRMRTCLNLIPLNEKYPPGEVVVRAMMAFGAAPSLIVTSAPATARGFGPGPVTMPPTVLGEVVGGRPSGSSAVSESSKMGWVAGRTVEST